MDSTAANRLAEQLGSQGDGLCRHVAARLLRAFPELTRSLRLDESHSPTARLSQVAVARLNELVRSVLLFELPALADQELGWASGMLPRAGVTYEHQAAMIRWFFEEVRCLPISSAELSLAREIEHYLLNTTRRVFHAN